MNTKEYLMNELEKDYGINSLRRSIISQLADIGRDGKDPLSYDEWYNLNQYDMDRFYKAKQDLSNKSITELEKNLNEIEGKGKILDEDLRLLFENAKNKLQETIQFNEDRLKELSRPIDYDREYQNYSSLWKRRKIDSIVLEEMKERLQWLGKELLKKVRLKEQLDLMFWD